MNLITIKYHIIAYSTSILLGTIILVYIFKLPFFFTDNYKLIHEYYYKNIINSFIFDYFLIFIYIFSASYVFNYYNINKFIYKLVIMILTTFIISSSFYLFFISYPINKNSFFSKWFHDVKFNAVIYDIILVSCIFIIYKFILYLLT